MIIQEQVEGRNLIKTYSNIGKMLLQVETGAIYEEAIDIMPCPYTYVETEPPDGEDNSIEAEDALDILLDNEGE